jgi:predicted alpha/beta hydrolase
MKDQPAVVEFTLKKFKGYKLIMIGHSAGGRIGFAISLIEGHIMPVLPEELRSQIYRPIFLAANNAIYQFIPPEKLDDFLDTWIMTIKAAEKDGHLPKSVSYFGISLPAKPALEWNRAMLAEGQRHFAANPELVSFFRSWKPKNGLFSLAFDDDLSISNQNDNLNMDGWCDVFPSATITRVLVPHADYGMEKVGHIGMFKRENEKAWELMKDLAVHGRIPNGKVRRWIQGKSQL